MAVDLSNPLHAAKRSGLRRDGDGITYNAIRHIRGVQTSARVPSTDKPGILAMDYNGLAAAATDNYVLLWPAELGGTKHLRISSTDNDDPDTINEDADGLPLMTSQQAATVVTQTVLTVTGAAATGAANTLATGLTTPLAVFANINSDGAAPAANDTAVVYAEITGTNIVYDCFKADGTTAATTSMAKGLSFVVFGI